MFGGAFNASFVFRCTHTVLYLTEKITETVTTNKVCIHPLESITNWFSFDFIVCHTSTGVRPNGPRKYITIKTDIPAFLGKKRPSAIWHALFSYHITIPIIVSFNPTQ
jgi:hypothetical protein